MRSLFSAAAAAAARGGRRDTWRAQSCRPASTTTPPPPASATLARLCPVDHEATGVPAGAGVAGSPNAFDPGRMRALLAGLGNPHAEMRAVHVVGTKGKGSTAALLSAALAAGAGGGFTVGTYTSPHVVDLTERIAVGGRAIGRGELDALAAAGAPRLAAAAAAAGLRTPPTRFEALTALALRHFADAGVDVAVVEAGLGGATDATNVWGGGEEGGGSGAPPPAAVVAVPVGLEHAAALGGTLPAVAAAKAGILAHPGTPLILCHQPHAEADAAFRDRARSVGCPVVDVGAVCSVERAEVVAAPAAAAAAAAGRAGGAAPATSVRLVLDGAALDAALGLASDGASLPRTVIEAELALVGGHQAANAAAAAVAAAVLARTGAAPPGVASDAAALGRALSGVALPGRFQVGALAHPCPGPPVTVVLDGAHTPASAAALAASLRAAFPPPAPLGLVLASADDKDLAGVAAELARAGPSVVVFTSVPIGGRGERAAAPGALAGAWRVGRARAAALGGCGGGGGSGPGPALPRCRELVKASLPAAVDAAARELASASPGWEGPRVLCIAGSLHAVGEAVRGRSVVVV